MTIKEFAIKAFNEGSDKFGETVTGSGELFYNTMKTFGGKNPYYTMNLTLVQSDGHKCSSGIGFYIKENINGQILKACSGHMLPWTIEITPEIQAELDAAEHIDF